MFADLKENTAIFRQNFVLVSFSRNLKFRSRLHTSYAAKEKKKRRAHHEKEIRDQTRASEATSRVQVLQGVTVRSDKVRNAARELGNQSPLIGGAGQLPFWDTANLPVETLLSHDGKSRTRSPQ